MALADMPQNLKKSCSPFFSEGAGVHLIYKIAFDTCVWAAYSSPASPLITREA